MFPRHDESKFVEALASLAQTKANLGRVPPVPPELLVATGHEDEVLLFLRRVGDADATVDVLRRILTVSESATILTTMASTGGTHKQTVSD
jgi:hypothetical protein